MAVWKTWWVVRAEEPGGESGTASSEAPPEAEVSGTSDGSKEVGGGEGGEEAAPKQPDQKGRDRLNKRFSELTRTIYEERGRADAAERRLAELESRRGPPAEVERADEAPKLADFKEYEEYADARSRWVARQELRRASAAAREYSAREMATNRAVEIRAKWESAEAGAREKYEDYDEVMAGPVRFPESVAVALLDSEKGAEISYYLKSHPEEVKALRGLSPVAAARVIGRLELKLDESPTKKEQTKAPPPPKPTRSSAPTDELAGNISDSEWIRRRNKQELDRRRNG